MSHNSMIYLLVAFLVLLCATTEAKKECSIDCQEDGSAAVDLGLVLPPELYESTRLSNLLARPSSQFKSECILFPYGGRLFSVLLLFW